MATNIISAFEHDGKIVVDSRLIAARLGIQHKNFLETVSKYQTKIEQRFGQLAFKTEPTQNKVGAINHCKFAYLTEGQSIFLMTLSRNTDQVVEAKIYISSEFEKARQLSKTSQTFNDFLKQCQGNTQIQDAGGFVYLIQAKTTNYCKIGVSNKPFKRLTTLQIGSPLELIVIDRIFSSEPFKLEAALHKHYSTYWVRGEWFDLPDQEVKLFVKSANQIDFDIEQQVLKGL